MALCRRPRKPSQGVLPAHIAPPPLCLQERSLALLGFVAQLLNSVIVLLLVNANIKGIGTAATAMEFSFLNGSYTDFTQVRGRQGRRAGH